MKKRILGLYNKYVQNEKKKLEIAVDLQAEFINQREHLETNVKSLKLKFEKNMEAHLQVSIHFDLEIKKRKNI